MTDSRTAPPQADIARHCAWAALGMMDRHKIPPSPDNYYIWYSYVSGGQPDLKQAVDAILTSGRSFSDDINRDLYERFSPQPQDRLQLSEISQRIQDAVGHVLDYLAQARDGAATYDAALHSLSANLETAADRYSLGRAIATILTETRAMADLNSQLEQRLDHSGRKISHLRETLDSLYREAATDGLTQLANRKTFDRLLDREIDQANQSGRPLGLVMVDVDHFKSFNDTHGHPLGDQILRLISRALAETIAVTDTAARYGGEEFAVLLPDTGLDAATAIAEEMRLRVACRQVTNRRTGENLGQVTLSAGVACHAPGDTTISLIHRADEALYLAKRAGRNRVMSERDLTGQSSPGLGPTPD